MKKKNKKDKKIGRNIALILLIFFVIMLGLLSILFFHNYNPDPSGLEEENDPITKLTLMGEQLYSEYYYKLLSQDMTQEELIEHLKKYEEIGLKIDLKEMSKYNVDYQNYINSFMKDNKNCKKEDIMVTIYPQNPYTNKDFKSELSAQCDLKTKK